MGRNRTKKFLMIVTAGAFSFCDPVFLTSNAAWSLSGTGAYWDTTLVHEQDKEDPLSPSIPLPRIPLPQDSPKTRQPQDRDQDPPVIAPPIIDSEMAIPPPVTDLEMVVTPEQDRPAHEKGTQEEHPQGLAPCPIRG